MGVRACPSCSKRFGIFRWRHHCFRCKRVSCSGCLTAPPDQHWLCSPQLVDDDGDGYCPACTTEHVVPFKRRYDAAIANAHDIRDWSVNYAGRVPYDEHGRSAEMHSEWFKDRHDAIYQLKVTAAFLEFELLHRVTIHHRLKQFSEPSHNGRGTHYYNEPRYAASAVAAKAYVPEGKRVSS